jgi:hypothetical protein
MNTAPIVERVWEYGWLCRDSVQLTVAPSDVALIEQYVTSPAFQTSFLPSDKDETGIHGPFVADRIKAEDYISLQEHDLERYLGTIEFAGTPGEDNIERAKLLPHLRSAFAGGQRCYVLRRDERNKELFHDWGEVIWIFRELLFIGPDRDRLVRLILGMD